MWEKRGCGVEGQFASEKGCGGDAVFVEEERAGSLHGDGGHRLDYAGPRVKEGFSGA